MKIARVDPERSEGGTLGQFPKPPRPVGPDEAQPQNAVRIKLMAMLLQERKKFLKIQLHMMVSDSRENASADPTGRDSVSVLPQGSAALHPGLFSFSPSGREKCRNSGARFFSKSCSFYIPHFAIYLP